MRFIGLDLGTKTVGIAISDKKNMIASPLKTLHFQEEQYTSVIEELRRIITEKEITEIVLGLPKNMDNSLGFAAERTLSFQKILEREFSLPIHLVDERLSTLEAEKILISCKKSRAKRKEVIDNVAGAIILDTYLRERRKKDERERNL